MLIQYMSDLHTEFDLVHKPLSITNSYNADVLILAGDIVVRNRWEWILDNASKWEDVIYVMGNHEYYRGKLPETRMDAQEFFHGTNVHVLENSSVEIDEVMFHGATMWFSGNNNPISIAIVDGSLNDFRLIRTGGGQSRFSAIYATTLHKETVGWLEKEVLPGDIVITHHAPSLQSLHPKHKEQEHLNSGYVTDLEPFILYHQPRAWFHGHVHNSFNYTVGHTVVMCNPRGYYGHEINPAFNPNALYEVR